MVDVLGLQLELHAVSRDTALTAGVPVRIRWARRFVATLLVSPEQVKTVLVECIREGEDLATKAEIVEKAGGYSDWLHLFARWKQRTLTELRAVYDGDEIPLEFEAATLTAEHSTPRFTFPYRKATLNIGLWQLRALVERLPLAVEPQEPSVATRPVPSSDRPTEDLVTAPEDHYLEHKQTLRYDVRTKQVNPKLEDEVVDGICGFWNADGGTLLIGVEDRTGLVTGLGSDLKLVRDLDTLLNHLSQKLRNDAPSIAPLIRITTEPLGTEMVFRIDVPRGDRLVFLKDRFMVRINNTTQELKGQAQLEYIRSRFGR